MQKPASGVAFGPAEVGSLQDTLHVFVADEAGEVEAGREVEGLGEGPVGEVEFGQFVAAGHFGMGIGIHSKGKAI